MNHEFLLHSPQEIEQGLNVNPDAPYRRTIIKTSWISPDRLPVVFHTSSSDGLNQVDPVFCQSFDYTFQGKIIPVTYVLPFPHVNRTRGASDIWGSVRKEAIDQSGIAYTYLKVQKADKNYGRIRMGSTMLDQYLLACANSGFIFKVNVAEIVDRKPVAFFNEFVSLLGLPVIDAYRFPSPSPIGFGAGNGKSLETHLQLDISRPELVGYQTLGAYLESVRDSSHRGKIIDTANVLTDHPENAMHGIFEHLVRMNRQALVNVPHTDRRLIATIELAE